MTGSFFHAANAEDVGGQVGSAAIKGEVAPTTAEGGPTAVPVLQACKPSHTGRNDLIRRRHMWPMSRMSFRQMGECEQRPGSVVGVGNASREMRPPPCSRFRAGIGVTCLSLLGDQPFVKFRFSFERIEGAGRVQRVDRESCDPDREVAVDRPATIRSDGVHQEPLTEFGDRMVGGADPRKTHNDETGQRDRFEEAPARRLNARQNAQASLLGRTSNQANDGISRRLLVMDQLPQRDQGRQGVTHHGKLQEAKP